MQKLVCKGCGRAYWDILAAVMCGGCLCPKCRAKAKLEN